MVRVKCISERHSIPEQLEVGKIYWMDEATKWADHNGNEYAQIYRDEKKTEKVGNMLCSHFCLQEDGNCMACDYYDRCNATADKDLRIKG